MSQNSQMPENTENLPFAALTFPFATIEAIGSRVFAAIRGSRTAPRKEKQQSFPTNPGPMITQNLHYVVADRTFKAKIHNHNVSFFHYYKENLIRVSCRELGNFTPVFFTPSTAEKHALRFDIDGAIQWVQKFGLETTLGGKSPAASHVMQNQPSKAVRGQALEQNMLTVPDPIRSQSRLTNTAPWENSRLVDIPAKTSHDSTGQLNIVPAVGSKAMPFEGRIVSFGPTTRSNSEDDTPYLTYAVKVESRSGAYSKEFIGEHLSELVPEMKLTEGQLVCIQLVGKYHFKVEVNGKMQPRNRNHFHIKVL